MVRILLEDRQHQVGMELGYKQLLDRRPLLGTGLILWVLGSTDQQCSCRIGSAVKQN